MNDPISWDPSLVKKYSSSNHYKLLNQLKNEVKKYPLNNKKNASSNKNNNTNLDNSNESIISNKQNSSLSNNSNKSNELNSNESTVSFNNAKDFSIYNKSINNNISRQNQSFLADPSKSSDNSSSATFKDRLNQIDLK